MADLREICAELDAARAQYNAGSMMNANVQLTPEQRIDREVWWAQTKVRLARAEDAYNAEIKRLSKDGKEKS